MTVFRGRRENLPEDEENIDEDAETSLTPEQETARRRRLEEESEDTADQIMKAMDRAEG